MVHWFVPSFHSHDGSIHNPSVFRRGSEADTPACSFPCNDKWSVRKVSESWSRAQVLQLEGGNPRGGFLLLDYKLLWLLLAFSLSPWILFFPITYLIYSSVLLCFLFISLHFFFSSWRKYTCLRIRKSSWHASIVMSASSTSAFLIFGSVTILEWVRYLNDS